MKVLGKWRNGSDTKGPRKWLWLITLLNASRQFSLTFSFDFHLHIHSRSRNQFPQLSHESKVLLLPESKRGDLTTGISPFSLI